MACTYLLARLADSITDSGSWTLAERLAHLELWENAILKKVPTLYKTTASLGKLPEKEAQLVANAQEILAFFTSLPPKHQEFSQELLSVLIQGMKWDLKTFYEKASSNGEPVCGVKDLHTFDWYCFMIAGCVGRYWVQMFELPQTLEILAVAYGRGLQRINILRDVREDWERGRVYLPKTILDQFELSDQRPWLAPKWNEFVRIYCAETEDLLLRGANFCDALKVESVRLRWSSVMPLLIGVKTINKLKNAREWSQKIKIDRGTVKKLGVHAFLKVLIGLSFTPWVVKQGKNL